jgi:hypothetical protein
MWMAAAAAAAAASSVTGNARAIAFERAAYAVDNRAPGYTLIESGYFAMRALPSASGGVRFALDWGSGIVPGGWTAAIGSASYALHGGGVTGVDLVVSPAAQSSPDVSIEVLTTRHGVYWRPYRRRTCFTPWRVKPSFEAAVGTPLFVTSGHFDAPPSRFTTSLTVGTRNETIHATSVERVYGWEGHAQRASELDSFATSTRAAFASAISVAADGAGHPGFTIEQEWSAEHRTPSIPTPKVCA